MPQLAWPNNSLWSALKTGRVQIDQQTLELQVINCGSLEVPSGRLVVCDPFAAMSPGGNNYIQIPPGKYPVKVTLADVSEHLDQSHLREAYATVVVSEESEVRRSFHHLLPEGEAVPDGLDAEEYIGFPVDSGTACFVDDTVIASGMPNPDTWYETVFDNGSNDSWFYRMDNPNEIREGIANIVLPKAKNGENIVIIHSGWGDGVYPVIVGYDAYGKIARVHIDFLVVPDRGAEEAKED